MSGVDVDPGARPVRVFQLRYDRWCGWLLGGLGQQKGFPVPAGGAQSLTDALVRRLVERGGRVECGVRVTSIDVRGGRAVGVVAADGTPYDARRALSPA